MLIGARLQHGNENWEIAKERFRGAMIDDGWKWNLLKFVVIEIWRQSKECGVEIVLEICRRKAICLEVFLSS